MLLLNEGLTRMNPDPDKLTGQCQVEVVVEGLRNEVPPPLNAARYRCGFLVQISVAGGDCTAATYLDFPRPWLHCWNRFRAYPIYFVFGNPTLFLLLFEADLDQSGNM